MVITDGKQLFDRCGDLKLPVPPPNNYNPFGRKDELAAKFWELLRRNPAFRLKALRLSKTAYPDEGLEVSPENTWEAIGVEMASLYSRTIVPKELPGFGAFNPRCPTKPNIWCRTNPLALLTLTWLLRPKYEDLIWPTFGRIREVGDIGLGQARALAPCREGWEEEMQSAMEADSAAADLQTLRPTGGRVSLDTPWPEMPAWFRFLFSWLCEEVDPVTAFERPPVPGTYWDGDSVGFGNLQGPNDWSAVFGNEHELPSRANDLRDSLQNLLQRNLVVVIPKAPMVHKSVVTKIKSLKTELLKRLEDDGLLMPSTLPRDFLGSAAKWKYFSRLRSSIPFELGCLDSTDFAASRVVALDYAVEVYSSQLKKAGDITGASNFTGQLRRHYSVMEDFMLCVFPDFKLQRMLGPAGSTPVAPWMTAYEVRALDVMHLKFELLRVQRQKFTRNA
ncbi:MAG: hypothetical protein ABMA26_03385 [Limisphaerales bacterium]